MNRPYNVGAYVRLSMEGASYDSESVENQREMLSLFITRMLGWIEEKFYIDDGYSGTGFERPALQQLEDAIQAGYICAVITKDVSRLGRNYLKVGYYMEQLFPQHDVRFIAVTGDIDSDANAADILPLYSVMDEWYAKDISRKVRMMFQARVAKGEPISLPVYGYMKSPDNPKMWVPDPEAAEVVRQIYQLYLQGHGTEQIAKRLQEEQVLTPSHYSLRNGNGLGGKMSDNPYKWPPSTVAKILQRQEYCGDIVSMKTFSHSFKDKKRHANPPEKMSIIRNAHEPIIERQLWEYVQRKREQQKKYRQAGKQTLFSGFLRCGTCGSNMHFHFNQKNPSIEYFNCSNYVGNRGTCPDTHYIRVDFLEPRVLGELNRLIHFAQHQWEAFSAAVEQTATLSAKDQAASLSKKHQEFQNRMKELKVLLARLYEDKIKGVVDDETFVLLSSEFKKERGQIQKQMQRIQESLQKSNSILYGIALFKKEIDKQEPINSLDREHLGKYVDHITVFPAKQNGKERVQKFEIHYRFIGYVDMSEKL